MTETEKKLRELIEDSIERHPIAEVVLQVITDNKGKRFDRRRAEDAQNKIRDSLGEPVMVRLKDPEKHTVTQRLGVWRGQYIGGWTEHITLAIGRGSPLICDPDFFVQNNPAYFAGAAQRNADRRRLLDAPGLTADLASTIDAYTEAAARLDLLSADLDWSVAKAIRGMVDEAVANRRAELADA